MIATIHFYSDKKTEHILEITHKLELTHIYNSIAFGVAQYVKLEVGEIISIKNEAYEITRIEVLLKKPYEEEGDEQITIQVQTTKLPI